MRNYVKSSKYEHFTSDQAAAKLLWLAVRNLPADSGNLSRDWKEAMNQFAVLYEHRFTRTTSKPKEMPVLSDGHY